eukprot:scaffold1549_cov350-Prasinococcus_capsulatus_cf.AAC.14
MAGKDGESRTELYSAALNVFEGQNTFTLPTISLVRNDIKREQGSSQLPSLLRLAAPAETLGNFLDSFVSDFMTAETRRKGEHGSRRRSSRSRRKKNPMRASYPPPSVSKKQLGGRRTAAEEEQAQKGTSADRAAHA